MTYTSGYICVMIFPPITLWSFYVFVSLTLKANDNHQFPVGTGWRTVEGWWWKCTHLHLEERSRSRSQTERSAEKERKGDLDRKWNQQRHQQRYNIEIKNASCTWEQDPEFDRSRINLRHKTIALFFICFLCWEIWRTTISCASTVSFSCLIKAHLKNC